MIKLLVVCHGNICRSPLVSAVLLQQSIHIFHIRQGGLSDHTGRRAAKKIRDYCAKNSIDGLEEHRSRKITQDDVDWADKIIYMDSGNRKRLESYQGAIEKSICLGEYVGLSKIQDPNFIAKGPELDRLLNTIVQATNNFSRELLRTGD